MEFLLDTSRHQHVLPPELGSMHGQWVVLQEAIQRNFLTSLCLVVLRITFRDLLLPK